MQCIWGWIHVRERDESGEGRFESRRESNAKEKDPPGGGGENNVGEDNFNVRRSIFNL